MDWKSLNWIFFLCAVLLSSSVFVKTDKEREFFTVVFWIGIMGTIVLQVIGIHIFNWWHFTSDYFSIMGIPLAIIAGWIIGTILFITYFPTGFVGQFLYILTFSVVTVLISYHFVINGFVVYTGWNFFYTFLLAVIMHFFEAFVVMPLSGWISNENEFIK